MTKQQLKSAAAGFKRRLQRGRRPESDDRVAELERRVDELAVEVQECRQLNLRLAEITDVVQELLLPVSLQDEQRVADLLDRYANGI